MLFLFCLCAREARLDSFSLCFSRSVLGPSKDHPPDPSAAPLQMMPEPPLPDCLRFESRFESGNLAKVIRITEAYYEIYLRPDYYTSKHCQWFYFQVKLDAVWLGLVQRTVLTEIYFIYI